MKEFIESNPGLKSRFTRVLHFDDYNEGQLYEIFTGLCDKYNLFLDDEAAKCVTEYFKQLAKGKTENFGNAREVRKFFEKITVAQSMRIADNKAGYNFPVILKKELKDGKTRIR